MTQPEAILSGRYSRPGVGSLVFAGIALLCLAAAIKFMFLDQVPEVAIYPALSTLICLVFPALGFLRAGRFEIGLQGISGKRRLGRSWALQWDEVGGVGVHKKPAAGPPRKADPVLQATSRFDRIELLGPDGSILVSLRDPRPAWAPGVVWMLLHLRGRAPNSILESLGRDPDGIDPLPEIRLGASREIFAGKRLAFRDAGFVVSLRPEVHIYQPTTITEKVLGLGTTIIDLLSPVPLPIRTRMKFGDAPSPSDLPLLAWAQSVVQSRLLVEQKADLLGSLATELGGMVFLSPPDEHGCLAGEIGGQRAEIRVRAPHSQI